MATQYERQNVRALTKYWFEFRGGCPSVNVRVFAADNWAAVADRPLVRGDFFKVTAQVRCLFS